MSVLDAPAPAPALSGLSVDGATARGLAAPDVVSSLQSLARLVGPARALADWQAAAAPLGLHGTALAPADLARVADALRGLSPLHAVFANSVVARVRAFDVLRRTQGASA